MAAFAPFAAEHELQRLQLVGPQLHRQPRRLRRGRQLAALQRLQHALQPMQGGAGAADLSSGYCFP